MKSKTYQLFFSCLQKLMVILAVDWVIVAVLHLFHLDAWALLVGIGLASLLFLFRERFLKLYHLGMRHKLLLMAFAFVVQLVFLFSAQLLIRRDAAVVFMGAFGYLKESSISSYLTRNPNNLFLFLYERFFFELFGETALWVLEGLNLLYVHLGVWILYRGSQRHFGQAVADTAFSLYLLLLGLSPYFYSMYTDIPPVPLIAWQLFLALDVLQLKDKKLLLKKSLLLGLVSALVVLVRPPGAILMIAFFMLLFLKAHWRKSLLVFLGFLLSFGLTFGVGDYQIDHQTKVPLVQGEGLSKGPLLFINLGLTYIGHDQEDMKEGLLNYVAPDKRDNYNNGMFKTEYVLKEIKRRLKDYTFLGFLGHLNYKHSLTVSEGTLGWLYRDVQNEKTPFISPLYSFTEGKAFFEWVRTYFLSTDKKEYRFYAIVKQCIWIVMSVGLLLAIAKQKYKEEVNFLSLAIFGALAFLLIFEGGKTRYLIQFLPQILLLASLGLAKENSSLESSF